MMKIGTGGMEASLLGEDGGRRKKEVDSVGEYEGFVDGL
jgi:hypothetical protein